MNRIKLDRFNNVAYYDDLEIEDFKTRYFTESGVLEVTGKLRLYRFSYEKVFDKNILDLVEDSFYQTSFWTGQRSFVQGWYRLKERESIRLTSNSWSMRETL